MHYSDHGKVTQGIVTRMVKEVYYLGDTALRDCPYFNTRKVVTDADVASYFDNHHQIRILQSDELHHPTLAMTVKLPRGSTDDHPRPSRFSILLNKREIGLEAPIPPEYRFDRLRILGHELGHVFLHAKHQPPGTISVFRSDGLCNRTPFHCSADLQSDIFALTLLIGDWMLEDLRPFRAPVSMPLYFGQCADQLAARYLDEVGYPLPIAAARDRICIFGVRCGFTIPAPFQYLGREGPGPFFRAPAA